MLRRTRLRASFRAAIVAGAAALLPLRALGIATGGLTTEPAPPLAENLLNGFISPIS
jgi:hypothetical protein